MKAINENTKVAWIGKLFASILPSQMTNRECIFVLNEVINVTLISHLETYQFLVNIGSDISLKEDSYWHF